MDWSELLSVYRQKCQDFQIEPNRSFVRYLEDSQASDGDNLSILLPGNEKLNFKTRLEDLDVIVIVSAVESWSSRLTHIDFSHNKIGGPAAQALSMLIKDADNLRDINLQGNEIDGDGCRSLAQGLLKRSVARLNLSGNPIGTAGGMAIAELLQHNEHLLHLDLANTELGQDAVIAIAGVLHTTNSTLQSLNLENPRLNSLQEETVYHIARMLRVNRGLQHIYLGKNKIRDYGMRTLAENLIDNRTLKTLDLRANEVTMVGAEILAKYLKNEACFLQVLILSSNGLADAGAVALASAVAVNRSLAHLDLAQNNINRRGLEALADGLQNNSTLQSIRLFGNHFDEESSRAFHDLFSGRFRYFHWITDFQPYVVDGYTFVAKIHETDKILV